MSTQRDLHSLLDRYASGSLNWEEILLVDEHLRECDSCRRRFPAKFRSHAEDIADSPPPDQLWDRIRVAIDN